MRDVRGPWLALASMTGLLAVACGGGATPTPGEEWIPNRHERPIRSEDGRTWLWASEDDDGTVEWFDMTGATVDPRRFQYGIGKDRIASIDEPEFVAADDRRLAERGIDLDTQVLGVAMAGIARAYPVKIMDMHEVVNDSFGGTAYAVLW